MGKRMDVELCICHSLDRFRQCKVVQANFYGFPRWHNELLNHA